MLGNLMDSRSNEKLIIRTFLPALDMEEANRMLDYHRTRLLINPILGLNRVNKIRNSLNTSKQITLNLGLKIQIINTLQ